VQNEKYQHQAPLLAGILRNVKYALSGGRKKAQAPPEPDKENSARNFAPGQEARFVLAHITIANDVQGPSKNTRQPLIEYFKYYSF
jgi:hypothetical protein